MSKRHVDVDTTLDENPPKRRKLSADEVLVEAAKKGDTTAVRAGLEKLRRVVLDAVHEACRGNHDECLAPLLPYVETTQMGFGNLLSECVHADHVACTEVLLQHWKSVCSNVAMVPHGQEANIQGNAPRACPAMWADPAVCQVLIDAGADIETKDDTGRSPLHWACRSGALAVVKLLVKAGAGVRVTDNKGYTCLIRASYHGHTETVRYLVGLPQVDLSNKNNHGCTALHCAADQKHADVVEVLIDAGADIDMKDNMGGTPLHWTCRLGALDVMKLLVKAGAGVGVTDNDGNTCLILAAYSGYTETVRYLVGLPQVDVNNSSNRGFTSLHRAVLRKHSDVVKVLIDAGADVEAMNSKGRTPLRCACTVEHPENVQMLVEAGADVCAVDDNSDRCLSVAARYGHTETVRYLVGLPEVDVNHRNLLGHTALDCAGQKQHADVVQVLLEHRGEVFAQ